MTAVSQNDFGAGNASAVQAANAGFLAGSASLADRVSNSPLARLLATPSGIERFGSAAGGYTVQSGDTLSAIAKVNGTTVAELARVNGIDNPDRIDVGDRLIIPTGTTQSHVVRRGETLSGIAAANGTSVAKLQRLNGIANADKIAVGQRLNLGNGARSAPRTAPVPGQAPATPPARPAGTPTATPATPAPTDGAGQSASTGRASANGAQFIYDHEAVRGVSNRLHFPGGASGVTLGPGYDMKGKSAGEIVNDLTAIGVDRNTATQVARGAGLSGSAAKNFAAANKSLVNLTLTQEKALLQKEITTFERVVAQNVKVPLTQNQFDALVSFSYNIGAAGFKGSTALARINSGDMAGGAAAMKWWNKSGGHVMQGLVNRRNDEVGLFNAAGSAMVRPSAGTAATGRANPVAPTAAVNPAGRTGADYAARINTFGDAQAKADLAAGKSVVVAIRNETNTHANGGKGVYDDTIAVVRRNGDGSYSVREFSGNTEPSAQYAFNGRKPMGRDMNGDGKVDQGRLMAGSYRFAPNGNFLGNASYRATRNQVAERDTNQDGVFDSRDSNRIDRTGVGTSMLIHQGGANNTYSAGCQTMSPTNFNNFLNAVGRNTSFSYVLINNGR
jgi:GH24 family phage-related lysozyme (muramidase)/LysM repeat protein